MANLPFLFVDKPAGIPTHATDVGDDASVGFVEYLSFLANQKLFVNHRLDKGTTGALVFSLDGLSTASLAEQFASREVDKTYLFITDREVPNQISLTTSSFIEKRSGKFISEQGENNSETDFRLLVTSQQFSLWEAKPKTGKPHQIRLHAADLGIPILGDSEHGGTPYPALCLHAAEINFSYGSKTHVHRSEPPIYFHRLELLTNVQVCGWLAAWDRRKRWISSRTAALTLGGQSELLDLNCYRAIHTEGEELRAEVLGEVLDLQWFSEDEIPRDTWADIELFLQTIGAHSWRLHLRHDRGRKPQGEQVWTSTPVPPARWTVHENGLNFEMRSDSGLSSGLFLDQRANRRWLRENAQGKSVLNLFSYTSGFSVAAARGGATKAVSVDLSKNFLEWSKTNFALNGVPLDNHEFRAMDAREYLKWAKKKEFKFDIVICDPPSFSRSDKGVFKIEKDLGDLLRALDDVTAENGCVLFCANYEGWHDTSEFRDAVQKELQTQKLSLKLGQKKWPELPPADLDFELPGAPRLMKALKLERV